MAGTNPLASAVAFLAEPGKAEHGQAIAAEVATAIATLTRKAADLRAVALDASQDARAARQARDEAADLLFDVERLEAVAAQLGPVIAVLADEEAKQDRAAAYETAIGNRDAARDLVTNRYAALVAELIEMAQAIATSDAEVDHVNHFLPSGAARLETAEALARGAHIWMSGELSIVRHMKLPSPDGPHRMAWPIPAETLVGVGGF